MKRHLCVLAALLGGVLGAPAGARAQDGAVAFMNARIIPVRGNEIERGVLVARAGRIEAMGPVGATPVPPDAEVVDCAGKVIMPGLICTHSHIGGVAGADSSSPIQPGVRILDSINVFDPGFKRALAGGLTTLNIMPGSGHLSSGQTAYVKLRFWPDRVRTIEDILYYDDAGRQMGGLKMANGTNSMRDPPFPGTRGKSAALVRERFIKAQEYRDAVARAVDDAGNPDPSKLPARDLDLECLAEVIEGDRVVHHHTHRADDIITVLRLAKEFGFRVVLHHVSEAWKVADEIAEAGAPCSVILVDAPGGKQEAVDLVMTTGAVLERAGALVAYHTDDWITDSRVFLRMPALGVRAGMTRPTALEAVTINGAKILDLDSRIGSLEAGKDADLIVLSGDPFSVYTHVEQTWVEGRKVFDRSEPEDHLYAVGGFGAGQAIEPYLCCAPNQGGQQ